MGGLWPVSWCIWDSGGRHHPGACVLGLALGWQIEDIPGPFEDHASQISDQTGGAITNMEPAKQGMRAYVDVDDINAAAAREGVWRRGTSRAQCRAWGGRNLYGSPGQ